MKVLILTPTQTDLPKAFNEALRGQTFKEWQLQALRAPRQEIDKDNYLNNRMENIVEARNTLRAAALATDFEWFLWLDSDVILPPDGLAKLVASGFPVVGGYYHSHNRQDYSVCFDPEPGARYCFRTVRPGPIAADHIGMGCVLMGRAALLECGPFTHNKSKFSPFSCECADFCERAKEKGFQPMAIDVECGHLNSNEPPRQLKDYSDMEVLKEALRLSEAGKGAKEHLGRVETAAMAVKTEIVRRKL